jgi:hypothetical protein
MSLALVLFGCGAVLLVLTGRLAILGVADAGVRLERARIERALEARIAQDPTRCPTCGRRL